MPSPAAIGGAARLALRLFLASRRHCLAAASVADRLAALPRRGLPLDGDVEIRWNEHLVPYIEAQTDRDLAVALGLVHAHLRLAQMELVRRAAGGRLAETFGPVAVGIDHALHLLDPGRAVPAIERALPAATRVWLEGFVAGVNHHLAADVRPPIEFRHLGIAATPWTVEDVLRVARLLAADVNWLVWLRLLWRARGADWPELWRALLATEEPPEAALETAAPDPLEAAPSGSNAVAIDGGRSATGAPWLAGDPHLPLTVPSTWLCAACRSPSYHAVGLMLPGIPAILIGRNPWIAWGGTNLHAASSELFDVADRPAKTIRERRVRLAVRWSRPRDITLRETAHGPLISDMPALKGLGRRLALRWMGHAASDELSSLLAINRARDWPSFRAAAGGIAVPGQTLVYADRAGHIGRVLAAHLPCRSPGLPADLVSPLAAAGAWDTTIGSEALPCELDPECGFVVSANDRPPAAAVPVGWFFSPPDRARRLGELIACRRGLDREAVARLLQDVCARGALGLRDRLLAAMPNAGSQVAAALAGWDGNYAAHSEGALAFELVLRAVARRLIPAARLAAYGTVWNTRRMVARELCRVPPLVLRQALATAMRDVARPLRRFGSWGGAHRLRLAHPLARLPGAPRGYRFGDWPAAGSNDTVLKTAHGLVAGRHAVGYGSNARYLFDLSDLDGNYLVLLGGQDGALGSAAFLDQAALFRAGEWLRVPLTPAAARASFRHVTRLAR